MNNKIINRIEDLKPKTDTHIKGIQKALVPTHINLNGSLVFDYYITGDRSAITGNFRFGFKTPNLPYIESVLKDKEEPYFRDNLESVVSNSYMKPILVFYDGKFVPWSNIDIVRDIETSYILLAGVPLEVDDIGNPIIKSLDCIAFPFNITYKDWESGRYSIDGFETLIQFDENGKLTLDDDNARYSILSDNHSIVFNQYTSSEEIIRHEIEMPSDYSLYDFNFIIFKDGLYCANPDISIDGNNFLTVNESGEITCFTFYHKRTNINLSHQLRIPDSDYLKSIIEDNTNIPDYVKSLLNRMDFDFDHFTEYSKNVMNSLKSVLLYDEELMHEIYSNNSKIITKNYFGYQILNKSKNGYYTILSKIKTYNEATGRMIIEDIRVMIFINNELADCNRSIVYENNLCKIPTSSIKNIKDNVEILIFKGINNEVLSSSADIEDNIISDACTAEVLTVIEPENLEVYTSTPPSDAIAPITSIDEYDRVQYKLPIEAISSNFPADDKQDNCIHVEINTDRDYSGMRPLTFVSKKQFRHMAIIADGYTFNVMLDPEFNYCSNEDQYMIFINGRKINQDGFRLIHADPDRPFDDVSVYLTTEMSDGDRIDVYYLPMVCKEMVSIPKIPINGDIYLARRYFDYGLDKDLYLIFANGYKINNILISNIDSSFIHINNDIKAIDNVCVLQHVPSDEILTDMFKTIPSEWDTAIGQATVTDVAELMNTADANITPAEETLFNHRVTWKEIIFEIVRDYWLSERVYEGDTFLYDYDSFELTKEDFIDEELTKIEDIDNTDATANKIANVQRAHIEFIRPAT